MEEILHQFIPLFPGFLHLRWCRISEPSTVCSFNTTIPDKTKRSKWPNLHKNLPPWKEICKVRKKFRPKSRAKNSFAQESYSLTCLCVFCGGFVRSIRGSSLGFLHFSMLRLPPHPRQWEESPRPHQSGNNSGHQRRTATDNSCRTMMNDVALFD